jgi:PAS domain S-box-containing protein
MSKKRREEKVNILLVDDRPENLVALEAVLDSPEYTLVKASTGTEALKLLLKDDFGLILLDVFMPELNGFETAAMIRERPKSRNIPIIFITAVNKTETDAAKGYSLGAVDYILKPFDPDTLRAKVAALVDLYKKGRKLKEQLGQLEKLSQERYRNLANAIPQIVWIARPNGMIDFFNQQWFSYTGLSFEQSEGWGWRKVIHPEDLPYYLDRWEETLKIGIPFEIHGRLKRADGVYRWHLVRALPERDRHDQTIAWLGTSTDIDDQKRAEAVLKQKTLEAEEATRIKSEFVSNVSHELRTPLNAIIGYASLLLQETYGPVSDHQKPPVEGIQRNASELSNLINNLLDLSKMESGKVPLVIEPVDLGHLLSEVFENVKGLISGKRIEIRWNIQEGLVPIQSDPSKIRQVLLNLLSNAIKFTEAGSITLSASNYERGIQFSIADTGVGMKQEDLPYIFEPFRQIDGSITRKVGGSGLGLTIVKNVLTLLHGKIEVRSESGRGSTFTVFLPERLPGFVESEGRANLSSRQTR